MPHPRRTELESRIHRLQGLAFAAADTADVQQLHGAADILFGIWCELSKLSTDLVERPGTLIAFRGDCAYLRYSVRDDGPASP